MSVSLSVIAALGSLAATGYGAWKSAEANADAQEKLEAQNRRNMEYYSRLLNRDYVNSSENQSLLRRLQEIQRKNYERARATNVVAGGTDASLAALQQAGNQMVTQTAQGIAARADAYKDRVGQAKLSSENAHAQQMFALGQQKAQNIAQAAGQASKAFAGIASAAGGADNPFSSADAATKSGGVTEGAVAAGAKAATKAPVTSSTADINAAVNSAPIVVNGRMLTPEEYLQYIQTRKDAQDVFSIINQ